MRKKRIAITMGDPAGVGPEVVAKALLTREIYEYCVPMVIGDPPVMEEAAALVSRDMKIRPIPAPSHSSPAPGTIDLIDAGRLTSAEKGRSSREGGVASAACIEKAVRLALCDEVDAVVTAPISKEAMKMAGLRWPGHTEMLAELTGTRDYAMMLVGGPLRVILVTIHASLRSVPDLITETRVYNTILLAQRACAMLGIVEPRIAVAALNPHAGEAGLFGDEEGREIIPAIERAKEAAIPVDGPYPPDTIFHKAYRGEVDIVVCMYHDQGLIPLKMIAFDEGVNVTVGLPIVRTSPDHGTAYDIAWKGKASPSSMIAAIGLASQLRR